MLNCSAFCQREEEKKARAFTKKILKQPALLAQEKNALLQIFLGKTAHGLEEE